MSTTADELPNHTNKRPRPVISCLECRRKKLKCDRTYPCQQCLKIGHPGRCHYQRGSEPDAIRSQSPGARSKRPRPNSTHPEDLHELAPRINEVEVEATVNPKAGIIEDLQERVSRLEKALFSQEGRKGATSNITGTKLLPGQATREVGHKGHTSSTPGSLFPDACNFIRAMQTDTTTDDIVNLRTDLKSLHYTVESHSLQMIRQAQIIPVSTSPLQGLPPEHICERLSVLYFDNLEHCFRILHGPDFRRQLKILFTDGLGPSACTFAFIPQLVGVLALGTILGTHTECHIASSYPFTQQSVALKFMDDFLDGLRGPQKYLLPALQVKMLALIVRWIGLDPLGDLFRMSGDILRDALVMRMDQEPSTIAELSVYQGELRRRTWMTIIEVDLMLSILCKLPCMVPPYKCQPPQNVNDDELFEGLDVLPPSRPTEQWTDGLCQYVLAHSYARRLAACQQLEETDEVKFDDVLQHIRYLEQALQDLPPPLRFAYDGDEESKTPARLMARMELDISIRRPLIHLYSSLSSAPNIYQVQPGSRAGFIQTCLMLTVFQDLFDPQFSDIDVPHPQGYWDFFYNVYRHELAAGVLGLCSEIIHMNSSTTTTESDQEASTVTPNASNVSDASASTLKYPSYAKTSMLSNVKDTLEPMIRRLTRPNPKLKDLVYYTIVINSVVPEQDASAKSTTIRRALDQVIQDSRSRLLQEGIPILHPPPTLDPRPEKQLPAGCGPAIGANFDPCWLGFPDLDLFEPLESLQAHAPVPAP